MAARFANRREAGRRLAQELTKVPGMASGADTLVLAMAPGGVPVAVEVARALRAPLDVLVARTVNAPGNGTVLGAVARAEPPVLDRGQIRDLEVSEAELAAEVERQRAEARQRERAYRRGRPALDPAGRTVVLVSDGLTGGPTAKAAVRAVRGLGPARLVLAAPVCDARLATDLRGVDTLVCLRRDLYVHAVGPWYQDYHDIPEREVVTHLLEHQAA